MAQILVVEDDPDIQKLLLNFLKEAGYCITLAQDGLDGLMKFQTARFDLLILDIMLPKMDGYAMLELVRRDSDVPVVFLSALDEEQNQLKGYALQADDYITKPFSMQILLQKIGSILRRAGGARQSESALRFQRLCLDTQAFKLYLDDAEVEVTLTEFNLLKELLQSKGRVLSRDYLLDSVWGYDFWGDGRVVDTHVKNLRKKIPPDYIETVRGVGYRLAKKT